ncbi:MAG: UDP-N-acetylmuramate dehydrogenase [Ruminococcaceae bacterium]|nr:UDP-N-acetylmuramate dehydrogenase [Oscillospiraceae bacterium]
MINLEFVSSVEESGAICTPDSPMKTHTTFKIGGPADYHILVHNIKELESVLSLCDEYDVDYMLLGNGSNLLVDDKGLRKAVIRLGGDFKEAVVDENIVTCGAGATLARLCTTALSNSLSGLEFAFGIPGTVGGAVYMNAGAYGGEMKDVVISVTHMTPSGKIEIVPACDLEFSYRHSIYCKNNCIILSAQFMLTPDKSEDIKARMDDYMNRRVTKQPLDYPSAGSTFKRPKGAFAGALIEQCGLKGASVGGAQISTKHAGFIINTGDATCQDVMNLVKYVQDVVKKETGYTLEREIIYLS